MLGLNMVDRERPTASSTGQDGLDFEDITADWTSSVRTTPTLIPQGGHGNDHKRTIEGRRTTHSNEL
jgi:hypothetical protein